MPSTDVKTTTELFDGPFKVPLPRKPHGSANSKGKIMTNLQAPKPEFKKCSEKERAKVYQKLLVKLLQSPESITKNDMKILATHPVIRELLKRSKHDGGSNASFYIPIDTLLNPQLYMNTEFPVIFESGNQNTDLIPNVQKQAEDMDQDEEFADESTSSNHDCEEMEEKRVGFYTLKERRERILKYKQKLQRYKNGLTARQSTKKTRKTNKTQPRKNGRFVAYSSTPDDFSSLMSKVSEQPPMSCSKQFLDSAARSTSSDLNDIVSEITGIF